MFLLSRRPFPSLRIFATYETGLHKVGTITVVIIPKPLAAAKQKASTPEIPKIGVGARLSRPKRGEFVSRRGTEAAEVDLDPLLEGIFETYKRELRDPMWGIKRPNEGN